MNDTAAPTTPSPPLVAILRGLEPRHAAEAAGVLLDAGFRALEVPLNRPGALECIEAIVRHVPPHTLVGAGTVMDAAQVDAVRAAGARLIVMPHTDVEVIRHARQQGLFVAPGVFTASEAFAALKAGAHALKLFPAEVLGTAGLAALRTVLPAGTALWPVGGITPPAMAAWRRAGATGFGLGGALFQPGMDLQALRSHALAFVDAWHASSP
ncbi:2-dehydro-3-deoxy-6-phosphogalactonate aldolase [Schlegelella sp. S2-27]|uniref:2-dehydro-3-deoxy-6-phosphogalactonate aldolase n=1 Tax=Caldimonas mangrovi TaxID=2944811 RepID=A0ABT0YUK6_9BURK|nr:2-dehydro-3-deoxy-6-phosphogalactonate aldolase [Caldimonas mangrovi]MCM5682437.1 2-dehydro-3-deoxy-6-phosphogalactonate aldolase [Caldimonas mangrovi]